MRPTLPSLRPLLPAVLTLLAVVLATAPAGAQIHPLEPCSFDRARQIARGGNFVIGAGNWQTSAFPLAALSGDWMVRFDASGNPLAAALDPRSGLLRVFHVPDWLGERELELIPREKGSEIRAGGVTIDLRSNRRTGMQGRAPTAAQFPALLTVQPALVAPERLIEWYRPELHCPEGAVTGALRGAEAETLLVQTAGAETEFEIGALREQGVVTKSSGDTRFLALRWPATGRLAAFAVPGNRSYQLSEDGFDDDRGVEYDFFGRGVYQGEQVQLTPVQLGLYLDLPERALDPAGPKLAPAG